MSDHLRELDRRSSAVAAQSSISEQLARQSVVPMECTIPPDMTIAEWRRQRASRQRRYRRLTGRSAAAARPVPLPTARCDHLHDSTTRYDHDQKLLVFLLVCPVCGTEKVVESRHYEPRFDPTPASHRADSSAAASIHHLPGRRSERSMRRAA
jgi:hypothetical protein